MHSIKERQCIEEAGKAKAASAQSKLVDLQRNGIPFDNPLEGFTSGIEWKAGAKEKLKQVSLLPIVLILIIFLGLMVPIMYLIHMRELAQRKRELRAVITSQRIQSSHHQLPDKKTVESLWRLHGLNNSDYNDNERIALLSTWVAILYGKEESFSVDLDQRLLAISERQAAANRPYYEGNQNAAHFHFMSPVDALIVELSEELPSYDRVA